MPVYLKKVDDEVVLNLSYKARAALRPWEELVATLLIFMADRQSSHPSDPKTMIEIWRDAGISGDSVEYVTNWYLATEMPNVKKTYEDGYEQLTVVEGKQKGESVVWDWIPKEWYD